MLLHRSSLLDRVAGGGAGSVTVDDTPVQGSRRPIASDYIYTLVYGDNQVAPGLNKLQDRPASWAKTYALVGDGDKAYARLDLTPNKPGGVVFVDENGLVPSALLPPDAVTSVAGTSGAVTATQILTALTNLGVNAFVPYTRTWQEKLGGITRAQVTATTDVSLSVRQTATSAFVTPLVVDFNTAVTPAVPRVRLMSLPALPTPASGKQIGIDPTTWQVGTLPIYAAALDWSTATANATPADTDLLLVRNAAGANQTMTRKVFLDGYMKVAPADTANDAPIPMLFLNAGTGLISRSQTMTYNPADKTLTFLERGQLYAFKYTKDSANSFVLGVATDATGGYVIGTEKVTTDLPLRVNLSGKTLIMFRPPATAPITATSTVEVETFGSTRIDGLHVGTFANIPVDTFAGIRRAGAPYAAIGQDAAGNTRINGTTIVVRTGANAGLPAKTAVATDVYRAVVVRADGQLFQEIVTSTSSEKFKRDIHDARIDGQAWVSMTRPVTFYYTDQVYPEGSAPHFGLIAEALHDVPALRRLVTYADASHSRESVQGIDRDAIPFWNLAGLNYLYQRIERLEAHLSQMEAK